MRLAKPQVKALLEIMSSDDARPALCHAWIENINDYPQLVATDSYHAVMFKLPRDMDGQAGESISRTDLTRFYKLMERKDSFSDIEVMGMVKKSDRRFPAMGQILDKVPGEGSTEQISFNARYASNLEKVAGQPLIYKTTGKLNPMTANIDGNTFILMPLK